MPDQDREELQREIAHAKADLAERVAVLEHAVREKVDVRARARVAAKRAQQRLRGGVERARDDVRTHPRLYALIALGVVMLATGVFFLRRARA